MIGQETLLVTLIRLVNRIPLVAPAKQRKRGRPTTYPDRLFLQALVMACSPPQAIMIVRHLYTVHELLSMLSEPIAEMQTMRSLLTIDGRFPTRRTWERRLQALPAQIGCLGRVLVGRLRTRGGH